MNNISFGQIFIDNKSFKPRTQIKDRAIDLKYQAENNSSYKPLFSKLNDKNYDVHIKYDKTDEFLNMDSSIKSENTINFEVYKKGNKHPLYAFYSSVSTSNEEILDKFIIFSNNFHKSLKIEKEKIKTHNENALKMGLNYIKTGLNLLKSAYGKTPELVIMQNELNKLQQSKTKESIIIKS